MITRRSFLGAILASGVAPAVVHKPMKLWVPKQEIIRLEPVDKPPLFDCVSDSNVQGVGVCKLGEYREFAALHKQDIERSILFAPGHTLQKGDIIQTSAGLLAVVNEIFNDREFSLAANPGRYESFDNTLTRTLPTAAFEKLWEKLAQASRHHQLR
jgi:hypothetical protein